MPFVMSPKGRKFMGMSSAASAFGIKAKELTVTAAETATTYSRAQYVDNLVGRPQVPARASRASTLGRFESLINWESAYGMVKFDRATLDEEAWYWVVLEIGTGKSANVFDGPTTSDLAVPSQRGRELPRGFYWGNEGGSPAAGPGLHNLFPFAEGASYTGYASTLDANGDPIRIKREIKGKHFVQEGGLIGYQDLYTGLAEGFRNLITP